MKTYKAEMKSPNNEVDRIFPPSKNLILWCTCHFLRQSLGRSYGKPRKWTTWWNRANPGKTSEKTTLLSLTQPHETRAPQIQFYHLTPSLGGGGGVGSCICFHFLSCPLLFSLVCPPLVADVVFFHCFFLLQGGPGTEPEAETGTVGTVFPGTESGTGTAGTVFQEPKPEPERSFPVKLYWNTEKPFLQRHRRNRKPEPLEPFHLQTVTEPNRGLPAFAAFCKFEGKGREENEWNKMRKKESNKRKTKTKKGKSRKMKDKNKDTQQRMKNKGGMNKSILCQQRGYFLSCCPKIVLKNRV